MKGKVQIEGLSKKPAGATRTEIPQYLGSGLDHEEQRPAIAAQLEGAARLGHSLGAVRVDSSLPPIIQCQEIPDEDEEELQMKREPTAIQRQVPEEEEEELQMKPESAAIQRQELPEEEEEELQMKQEPAAVQRQELPEEEDLDEALQMKREPAALQRQELPDEEDEGEFQTKPVNAMQRQGRGGGFRLDDETAGRINRARGGGQPLEGVLQEQMSASLGHDFCGVRVHTDSEADALNQQLQAKAFTTGPDIFFKRGAYDRVSSNGRKLIAHELSHVVQQGTDRVPGGGGGSGMTVRPAGDAFEQEADALAREAVSVGDSVGAHSREDGIQQQGDIEREALQTEVVQGVVTDPSLAAPANTQALEPANDNRAVTLRHLHKPIDAEAGKNGYAIQRMGVYMTDDVKVGMQLMDVEGDRVSMIDLELYKLLEDCKDKRLTMFGHAGKDSFGNYMPDMLADELKEAGIESSKIGRIDLIGCAASVKGEVRDEEGNKRMWSFAEQFKAKIEKDGKRYGVYTMPLPITLREMNQAGQLDSRLFQFPWTGTYIFISGDKVAIKSAADEIKKRSDPKKAQAKGKSAQEQRNIERALVQELLVFLNEQNIHVRTGKWSNLPHELVTVVEKPPL